MRKNATPQEKRLWYDFLSKYPVRFQRQKAIDCFIADFYCSKAKLLIEIDCSHHSTLNGKLMDDIRTYMLEGYDLEVVRFTNEQVDRHFEAVCEYINRIVEEKLRLYRDVWF